MPTLTLLEIMQAANRGYDHDDLSNYFDQETGRPICHATTDHQFTIIPMGDTLAAFIAIEISDTFCEDDPVGGAIACLESAIADIEKTISGLETLELKHLEQETQDNG